jgi:hypothetical protein
MLELHPSLLRTTARRTRALHVWARATVAIIGSTAIGISPPPPPHPEGTVQQIDIFCHLL